jgi:glyoxylate reductase
MGMGSIGRAVARRAVSFGMRVVYHNRRRLDVSLEKACQAQYTDRENLLRHSDFVSLNVPLNSETRGLIGAPELRLMKTSAFLVNTSRGQVVQQKALIEALKKKEIAGAALDVFEDEPHVPDELLGMTNVVVLPHVGGATHEARLMMSKEVAGIIGDFFAGRQGFPVINPTVWQLPQLRIQK